MNINKKYSINLQTARELRSGHSTRLPPEGPGFESFENVEFLSLAKGAACAKLCSFLCNIIYFLD